MAGEPEVSHGRGGVGNIVPDGTQYVDGEIVRAGVEGSHGDGAFSAGRGGLGNIGDAGVRPSTDRADRVLIPEAAVRPSSDLTDFHTGRGGAGNEKHVDAAPPAAATEAPATNGASSTPVGLADKIKHKIFGAFKK